MPLIQLESMVKRYPTACKPALDQVSLTVEPGEWLAIVGASGSGKSTLLHLIGLLDQATSGTYHFQQQRLTWSKPDQLAHLRNRWLGFIFQAFYLLPHLTALENVALPLWYQEIYGQEAAQRAYACLEYTQMAPFATRYPQQLSGGQQQRVAIARALVTQAPLLLADEPTGSLDQSSGEAIMALFRQLHEERKTILMVTHNPILAAQCQRIVRLHDGVIVEDYATGSV